MPEIAEVRLIADNIEEFLKGNKITNVELLHPEILVKYVNKSIKGLAEFNSAIASNPIRVIGVRTKGKFCWIETEGDWTIMIGFGMSGNVRQEPTDEYLKSYNANIIAGGKPPITRDDYLKHCHLKINFIKTNDGSKSHFFYHDIRRFGTWNFSKDPSHLQKHLTKLGHDPLNEPELSSDAIIKLFRRFDYQNICKALMSQEMFAGVGNFIKAETLYESRIHPLSVIKDLHDIDLLTLYKAIRKISKDAYEMGGASLYTYTGMNGDKSPFKDTLKIYNRTHDPLGHVVKRIPDKDSPDKRSTYWVSEIQTIGLKPLKKIIIKRLG